MERVSWVGGRQSPQHHLILVFLCLSFSRKNEGENSSRNKFFSCFSLALTFINGCLAVPSLNTTPDGRNGLLPIERSVEQLYHKSCDPAVVSILSKNCCDAGSSAEEGVCLAGTRACLFEYPKEMVMI